MRQISSFLVVTGLTVSLVGCEQVEVPSYGKNLVYEYVVEQMGDQHFGPVSDEIQTIVATHFGTLQERKVPDDLVEVIDHTRLDAGAAIYDRHCATCHGLNGDGRGPAAALLSPYPRDYRPGVFKFKSSLPGEKPSVADIVHLVKTGINGTSMKAIPELTEEDHLNVAHYVAYLSTRGQFERTLMLTAGFDFDLEGGEQFYPPAPGEPVAQAEPPEDGEEVEEPEDYEGMDAEEADELIADLLLEVADSWLDSENFLEELDPPEFITAAADSDIHKEAVAKGKEVFATKAAACSGCHRENEKGEVVAADKPLYDVWSEEWTTRIGLDPKDESQLIPIIARGALPPREAVPRHLGKEPLRGGEDPRAIYAKIKYGIDGTPMPRATLGDEEVWQIVAYVLARTAEIPEDPSMAPDEPPTETPAASAQAGATPDAPERQPNPLLAEAR